MSKVILIKDARLGSTPQTWSLVREGTGPGRGEGNGFESVAEAEEFARKYGHEIVERRENAMSRKNAANEKCDECGHREDFHTERGRPSPCQFPRCACDMFFKEFDNALCPLCRHSTAGTTSVTLGRVCAEAGCRCKDSCHAENRNASDPDMYAQLQQVKAEIQKLERAAVTGSYEHDLTRLHSLKLTRDGLEKMIRESSPRNAGDDGFIGPGGLGLVDKAAARYPHDVFSNGVDRGNKIYGKGDAK